MHRTLAFEFNKLKLIMIKKLKKKLILLCQMKKYAPREVLMRTTPISSVEAYLDISIILSSYIL